VNKINRTIFQKRSLNIINKIQNLGFKPSSSLFLRPVFGYLYDIISHNFTIAASAIEISSRAKRYCVEKYPNLNFIEGNLHGYIKIDVSNKFDSIFCFHSLIHSINFLDDLKYLKSILDDGGFIVFSEEVISKPYNPFHILHTTDNIFEEILRKHFSNVIKLEDCEERGINLSCEKVTDSKTACDFIVSNPIF
jgi:SAM-dependent methyltransferase